MASTPKKRCQRLTPEQKKQIWSRPESNLGLGFTARGRYVHLREPEEFDEDGAPAELDFEEK